jgi:hypothetical protein
MSNPQADNFRQHYDEVHSYPPWQFGGRAMAAYLVERQLGEASSPGLS